MSALSLIQVRCDRVRVWASTSAELRQRPPLLHQLTSHLCPPSLPPYTPSSFSDDPIIRFALPTMQPWPTLWSSLRAIVRTLAGPGVHTLYTCTHSRNPREQRCGTRIHKTTSLTEIEYQCAPPQRRVGGLKIAPKVLRQTKQNKLWLTVQYFIKASKLLLCPLIHRYARARAPQNRK